MDVVIHPFQHIDTGMPENPYWKLNFLFAINDTFVSWA